MPDDDIDRDELTEIVLVFSPVDMGLGKAAGQAFQAALRAHFWSHALDGLYDYLSDGTRTIVKRAQSESIFQRIIEEVPGYVMVDEGFTEFGGKRTATLFVSHPFKHRDRPKVLDHKRVKML
jgi:hypothetical protein